MSEDKKTPEPNAVQTLRENYNKRREDSLKKAHEKASKIPLPKTDKQVSKPSRSSQEDVEV